jgi:hypothetical protein
LVTKGFKVEGFQVEPKLCRLGFLLLNRFCFVKEQLADGLVPT